MSASIHVHTAVTPQRLAEDLAAFVADRLKAGLQQHGRALLVVSGGSTPVPFFEALSHEALDWAHVHVTLADERWVPPQHGDSNECLVRQHLLKGPAAAARFMGLYRDEAVTPRDALTLLEADLAALPWPADVTVLGMGSDGHTASLFPHAAELGEALDESNGARCLAVSAPGAPNVPLPRISLTGTALLDARSLVVHITGQAKRQLLEQARSPGPVADLPIRLALHQQRVACEVFQDE